MENKKRLVVTLSVITIIIVATVIGIIEYNKYIEEVKQHAADNAVPAEVFFDVLESNKANTSDEEPANVDNNVIETQTAEKKTPEITVAPTEENTLVFGGRITYDEFIERFDKTLVRMTEDEEDRFLRDYEFVEVEPNRFVYKWEANGEHVCTIGLTFEDDYIVSATFGGLIDTLENTVYSLFLLSSFEAGMVEGKLPKLEFNETYYFGNYSVMKTNAGLLTMVIFYEE